MSILDKMAKVQALIERASSEGERQAALLAKERILAKQQQQPQEYTVRAESFWKKKLFIALCGKYGLQTYRYQRQKYTTTMVRISPALMNECLLPEFKRYSKMLDDLVQDIMEDLLAKIHQSEETVIAGDIAQQTTS